MKFVDSAETSSEELDSILLKALLEGLAPPRRPHHENEHASVVMPRRRSSEVILRQGGLGVKKFYVHSIGSKLLWKRCSCVELSL